MDTFLPDSTEPKAAEMEAHMPQVGRKNHRERPILLLHLESRLFILGTQVSLGKIVAIFIVYPFHVMEGTILGEQNFPLTQGFWICELP